MKRALTYIQIRLLTWSDWRVRRDDGGLGYPRKCAFTQEPSRGGYWTPEMDSQCYELDSVIVLLEADLKQAILFSYTRTGTNEQKGRWCGISRSTFERRVEQAEQALIILLKVKSQASALK